MINRREFLKLAGVLVAGGVGATAYLSEPHWWERIPASASQVPATTSPGPWSIEARYYASLAGDGSLNCMDCHEASPEALPVSYCHIPHTGSYVRCNLCPHHCIIADGARGRCRVRENRAGRLYSMVYGNPCAVHIDPIEKKPFYHFLPTAAAFSLATAGCNMRCLYCQNWDISQVPPEETDNIDLPPEKVVSIALQNNTPVIAFTYSEPIIFYEYMHETARLARAAGICNVVVSAGFIDQQPLQDLCKVVDAIKIDLKGYDEGFYKQVCQAKLKPVLETIQTIFKSNVHLEIVNLVVPTLNDSLDQLRALSTWLAQDISPDVPLHFSRFYPQYKLANLPPTPVETLDKARQTALDEGMRFVYISNVPGHPGDNTYCPNCGRAIITRQGFSVLEYHIKNGDCEYCGMPIPGVWWSGNLQGTPVKVPPG